MKAKSLRVAPGKLLLGIALALSLGAARLLFSSKLGGTQEVPAKKPNDYMSSVLSRNTRPLGLKENVALKEFLAQPSIKWAIRSGTRQILN
jgi:hypothetical protein